MERGDFCGIISGSFIKRWLFTAFWAEPVNNGVGCVDGEAVCVPDGFQKGGSCMSIGVAGAAAPDTGQVKLVPAIIVYIAVPCFLGFGRGGFDNESRFRKVGKISVHRADADGLFSFVGEGLVDFLG